MTEQWDDAVVDDMLDRVLAAQTLARFNGVLATIGKEQGKSFTAVRRYLWGLANRFHDYNPGPDRAIRLGQLTTPEIWFVSRAANSATKDPRQKEKPDPEYVSVVLNRPLEMIQGAWMEHGPAKGRHSFGIGAKE